MPGGSIESRLDRIEVSLQGVRETQVLLVAQVAEMNGHVDDLRAEVGRVPEIAMRGARTPITDRLHTIEGVVTPTAMEAAVHRALNARRTVGWTRFQKAALFIAALAGAVAGILRVFGVGT